MSVLPLLDGRLLSGSVQDRGHFIDDLLEACRHSGFFYLCNHGITDSYTCRVLEQADRFFDLPDEQKNAIHIRHSSNFRGFSVMKNERDWREQMHLGWEWSSFDAQNYTAEAYRLAGSNPWPAALAPHFEQTMLEYMRQCNQLGERLLQALAEGLGLAPDAFLPASAEPPYLLLKLICYYPQPNAADERPGVAPHCDWSWLTILLQDEVGGLEVLLPEGHWAPVEPMPGVLSINVGELLEIATCGALRAAPHRVVNPSQQRRRLSAPVFVNPPLGAGIEPQQIVTHPPFVPEPFHVHRVKPGGGPYHPFVFGDSEWQRKGLGEWCYCVPLHNT